MVAILHALGMFIADLFKSRTRLDAENLFLRHQLDIALRRRPQEQGLGRKINRCCYMSFDKTPKGAGQITVLIPATNNPIKSFKLVRNDCPNVGGIAKSGHRIELLAKSFI
jgi:hypothetical protein